MGFKKTLGQDSAFDLNLAPVLDIIVSIIPMLLLSVAFLQIKMIETPVPQVVAQASETAQKEAELDVALRASLAQGYVFEIVEKGKARTVPVPKVDGKLNNDALYRSALEIKRQHPHLLNVSLKPTEEVSLEEMVLAMDSLRKIRSGDGQVSFVDKATGQTIETDFLFPNITFGNIVGE